MPQLDLGATYQQARPGNANNGDLAEKLVSVGEFRCQGLGGEQRSAGTRSRSATRLSFVAMLL